MAKNKSKRRKKPETAPIRAATGGAGTAGNQKQLMAQAARHFQAGRFAETSDVCRRIIAADDRNTDALRLAGAAEFQIGRFDLAAEILEWLLTLAPDDADSWFNYANACFFLQRFGDARAAYARVAEAQPGRLDALNGLAMASLRCNQPDQAVEIFRQIVEKTPGHADAHCNLGGALAETGRTTDAQAAYARALEIDPDHYQTINNLGNLHRNAHRTGEALAQYYRSLEINPDNRDTHFNIASTLRETGNLEQAVQHFEKAQVLDPGFEDAIFLGAETRLEMGQFENWWEAYEHRWGTDQIEAVVQSFNQPSWDGSLLDGKKILVWAEQGVGDEIMFSSLLPRLADMGAEVIAEADKRLIPLFGRSFAGITFVERHQQLPNAWADELGVDCQIPAGSLGRYLLKTLDAFPRSEGYLVPNADMAARLKAKYRGQFPGERLVGVAWKTTTKKEMNRRDRTTGLDQWLPVLRQEGCRFISVQYGDVEDELREFEDRTGIRIHFDTEVDQMKDMEIFAAQVSVLDQIISIGISVVHVAGALGIPAWSLVPLAPSWRWAIERDTNPWYASVRIYRQNKLGQWDDMFEAVARALKAQMS